MKQYCRYCSHLTTGNGIWCDARQREFPEAYCKAVNTCKYFERNPMDAFFENTKGYKPRQQKQPNEDCEQMKLGEDILGLYTTGA